MNNNIFDMLQLSDSASYLTVKKTYKKVLRSKASIYTNSELTDAWKTY